MATKLIVNYSKRLGLPGYSSHQFSVSVETELMNVDNVAGESERLYSLLQKSVDEQMQTTGFVPPDGYGMEPANGNGRASQPAANANGAWRCSEKQQTLIEKIVAEHHLAKTDVEALAVEMFGTGVRQLDKLQASGLIDELLDRHGEGPASGQAAVSPGTCTGQRRPGMIAALEPVVAPPAPVEHRARTKVELLQTISPSRLNAWLGCRLKFYFRYVAGLRKPNTPARHIGTVVHAVLQQWNLARWRRTPLDADTVQAVFEQAWTPDEEAPIAWDPDEPETAVKAAAQGLLEMYLRETPIPPDEKPEAVEVSVEKDLAARGLPKLVGVIDLVRAGGRIVDFKTTGKTPNPEMALHSNDVQLTAYALLYREATERRESALELHHLVKTKTPKLVVTESGPATDAQETRFYRLVESYVRGLQGEDFVPFPGIQCAGCEFWNECRRWH